MSSISSALRCVLDKVEAATEKRKKVRYYLVFVLLQFFLALRMQLSYLVMNEFVYNKARYTPCLFHVSPHVHLNMHEQCNTTRGVKLCKLCCIMVFHV